MINQPDQHLILIAGNVYRARTEKEHKTNQLCSRQSHKEFKRLRVYWCHKFPCCPQ